MLPSFRPFDDGVVRATRRKEGRKEGRKVALDSVGCIVVMYSDCLSLPPASGRASPPVCPTVPSLSFGHGNCLKVFAYLLKMNRSLHEVIYLVSSFLGERCPHPIREDVEVGSAPPRETIMKCTIYSCNHMLRVPVTKGTQWQWRMLYLRTHIYE